LTWASAIPGEDLRSCFSGNINTISDDQPPEARACSSVLNTHSENFLSEGSTKQERILLSTAIQQEKILVEFKKFFLIMIDIVHHVKVNLVQIQNRKLSTGKL
jgi:hypothetical protein